NTLLAIDTRALIAATGKVVRADEFARVVEAHEIVRSAREHADRIRRDAVADIEDLRSQVSEETRLEAHAEFAASIVATTARIEAAFVGLEGRIVNTVMNAVQQILGELDDRALLQRIIRRALAQARSQKSLRLRVSTEQYEVANAVIGEILHDFPEVEFVDVVGEPSRRRGTCILDSEFGSIDASLDIQVASLRRGLADAFVGRRPGA
ncbi:MAG TPA: type III secretion system stator protein SctL, partial [Povalibacter sp.]|nr:type III secretion system stator protein SctL [Povalibacter sp.]